jgi:hypothetical protein
MNLLRGLLGWKRDRATPKLGPGQHRSEIGDTSVEPMQYRRRVEPLEHQPVVVHAHRLLDWLESSVWRGQRVLIANEIKSAYAEMCAEQALEPLPWNPVAAVFSRLIRVPGRPTKTYRSAVDPVTGERRRMRVYIIPSASSVGTVVHLRNGAGL